jgi:outer membrane protein TolC
MIAIGVGIGQTPELVDGIPEAGPEVQELSTAIKTALSNRAELFVYDERMSSQERALAMAQDQLRTKLDAVIGYRSENEDEGAISGSLLDAGSLTAGFEVSIPLDKTIIKEDRDTTARNLEVLKEMRAYRADQVVEEVRRAYRNRQAAEASLSIYSQNLQAAQNQLYLAQRMVEEGEGSNREVLDAQNALTRVESGVLSAKTDLYLAGIDLLYAMGEDLSTVVLK